MDTNGETVKPTSNEATTIMNGDQPPKSEENGQETMPQLQNEDDDEKNRTLFQNICDGFKYLRQRRDAKDFVTPPESILPSFLTHITISFIDPTSSIIPANSNASNDVQLYEKFARILDKDYGNTLTHVPYQLFRNNSNGIIEKLPIKPVVARSHGGLVLPDDAPNASAIYDCTWERPYCHVYLAGCESAEYYRNKVKPSIQMFVNQLEEAFKQAQQSSVTSPHRQASFRRKDSGNNMDSSQASSPNKKGTTSKYTPGPRYVIIYIPTGDRRQADDSAQRIGVGAKVVSRFAAARQRIRAAAPADTSSTHSGNTMDSSENTGNNDNTTEEFTPYKLNKAERELARRFMADFPNGNVCTLGTLIESANAADNQKSTDSLDDEFEQVQKIEWNGILKAIGTAVAAGFQDRCLRFDEELRKLDIQRRGEKGSQSGTSSVEQNQDNMFHLSNFFLVKESLAFTYEQMRLPAEALLHYEELKAYLPDEIPDDDDGGSNNNEELRTIALTGDALGFRGFLRSTGNFAPVNHVADDYLLAREISLLFQLHRSVRVAMRYLSFVESRFYYKKSVIDASTDNAETSLQRMIALHKWAFNYCWEFKIASEYYMKSTSGKGSFNVGFARRLCDLLDFAKARLMKLGEIILADNQLKSTKRKGLVNHIEGPWSPWTEPNSASIAESKDESVVTVHDFLQNALSSSDSFLIRYLDMLQIIADCNELCGRRRIAAKVRIDRMEIFDIKGDMVKAAKEILLILDLYDDDLWSACHFALLFRLAAFQRTVSPASEYLKTLVRCFSENMNKQAPKKAISALHADLESVVSSSLVKGVNCGASSLFAPIFGLEGITAPRALGTDRNLLKRLYTVGDHVCVTLSLSSNLPEDIKADSISINLVPFRAYVGAMEDNVPVKDSEVCKILLSDSPVTICSGVNSFTFDWLPKSAGQFIIAFAVVSWNGVLFKYTAKELKRPTIRIDVVPREPTQSFKVNPNYLVPGHEQPITFTFNAGTEVVKNGMMQIIASPGVTFLPPEKEPQSGGWVSSYEHSLPACAPSETVSVKTTVKVVSLDETTAPIQPLLAELTTSYNYANEDSDETDTECMETSMSQKIITMAKPALSLVESELVPYSAEKALLTISLRCNTPVPFTIKRWSLDLPANARLSDVGDLNESLSGEVIHPGDKFSLSFDCSFEYTERITGSSSINIEVLNEDGTLFSEKLKLTVIWPSGIASRRNGNPIKVELSSPTTSASLGIPVELSYKVSCIDFDDVDVIVYKVDYDPSQWMVSGQVSGEVDRRNNDRQQFDIKVMASAVNPGLSLAFPTLSFFRVVNGKTVTLPVENIAPPSFGVVPSPNQSSIAFPLPGTISRRSRSSQGPREI